MIGLKMIIMIIMIYKTLLLIVRCDSRALKETITIQINYKQN